MKLRSQFNYLAIIRIYTQVEKMQVAWLMTRAIYIICIVRLEEMRFAFHTFWLLVHTRLVAAFISGIEI